jgi:tetratricopeptide (TPR) repeat protein
MDARIDRLWRDGQEQIRRRQLREAQASFEALVQVDPWHVPGRLLLASVFLAQGRVRGAAEQARYAAFALPDDADLICRVATCLVKVGEVNAARACLQHPEVNRTRSGPALAALAHVHQGLGQHEESLALMDRARALGFDNPDFRYFRAIQLQFNGRIAEAEAELEGCLQLGPTFGRASLTLARLRRWTEQENHLEFIRQRLQSVDPGTEDHAAFEFALYKELEDLGRLDEAWAALERANAIMFKRLQYQLTGEQTLFESIKARCTPEFTRAGGHRFEGPTPIFIVGMPRSGTTLLERILGNHSSVTPAGELADFSRQWRWAADTHGHKLVDEALVAGAGQLDFGEVGRRYLEQTQWRARGRPFYVDKLPPNFMVAGFIRRALPQAKIIHMSRSPMELCFSNYRALFGDAFAYSYDLDALVAHHSRYLGLMAHWHRVMPGAIHDVDYANLVDDPTGAARKLLDFCGLPFEPQCIDTASNSTPVATLSAAQVREPIHARARQDWRRYDSQLQPMARALHECRHPAM